MKKIILILLLLLTSVAAEKIKNIEELFFYKTTDSTESIDVVQNKQELFKKIDKNEKFSEKNITYWLQVKLSNVMQSGDYMMRYAYIDFNVSSFTMEQDMKRLNVEGSTQKMTFEYNKERDSQVYYFKLLPNSGKFQYFMKIQTMEEFYNDTNDYFYYVLFCGVILGLILMTGFYNAFMYYYNREKSFLYYAFMQFSMVFIQLYYTDLIPLTTESYQIYNLFSLLTAFFATLFIRSFFNTSIYLARLDIFLKFYMVLLIIDTMLCATVSSSLISEYRLYSVFGLIYLIIGYLRLRQGFKPAIFFLIGWSALIVSLFALEYFESLLSINPMLLGSAIEAILLAIALAYKIKLMQNEKEQQKELMIHQSKLASMGEMIGNIAHQWRQPLTHLSYNIMNIQDAHKHKMLDEVYLDKKVKEATTQIEFMSQTIDDFKDFYAPSKVKEEFSLEEATNDVLEIMNHAFHEKDIEVDLFVRSDVRLFNHKNEYKQVLLNLLSNAKDVLVQRNTMSPKILIMISNSNVYNGFVSISDNAGGIEPKIIHKIFEPYFTTKEEHSGIGLYMSKMIVEKNMDGKLTVSNDEKGAEFMIIF